MGRNCRAFGKVGKRMMARFTKWDHATPEERFWTKVEKTEDCWLWTASKNADGYGQFGRIDGKMVSAHRFAYELMVGPIPDGLAIDHLCRIRHCVNPEHLEAVTHRENCLRGIEAATDRARKTHCLRGHLFDEDNTYCPPEHPQERTCRKCKRIRQREYRTTTQG